jgi:hypothetical protein
MTCDTNLLLHLYSELKEKRHAENIFSRDNGTEIHPENNIRVEKLGETKHIIRFLKRNSEDCEAIHFGRN